MTGFTTTNLYDNKGIQRTQIPSAVTQKKRQNFKNILYLQTSTTGSTLQPESFKKAH